MLFFLQGNLIGNLPFHSNLRSLFFVHWLIVLNIYTSLYIIPNFIFRKKVLFSDTVGFISDLPVQVMVKHEQIAMSV